MKKSMVFLCICIITCANTCEKDENCSNISHNELTIKNESNRRIQYEIYWNYPDTLIGEYSPINNGTNGILPNASISRGAGPNSCWESVLMNDRQEWVYLFDADTIERLDWNIVRQTNRGLLERKEINLHYLNLNDFLVIYK